MSHRRGSRAFWTVARAARGLNLPSARRRLHLRLKGSAVATSTTIPILDLEPYMRGDPGAMEDAAARLRQINETVGFLYIVNHGVDRGLVDRTFEQAERFHAQPLDRKLAAKVNTAMQGYLPVRGSTTRTSTLSTGNKPNENEAFFIKRSGDDAGPGEVWPQGLDGFRETALAVATVPLRMTRSRSGMKRPPVARGPPRCEQSACRRLARGHHRDTPRPVRPTGGDPLPGGAPLGGPAAGRGRPVRRGL